jgi:hypothetical protein
MPNENVLKSFLPWQSTQLNAENSSSRWWLSVEVLVLPRLILFKRQSEAKSPIHIYSERSPGAYPYSLL